MISLMLKHFFVAVDEAWVKTYDINGKKICTLSKQAVGEVIGVSGSTFTCREGIWIKIYDKKGKNPQIAFIYRTNCVNLPKTLFYFDIIS